MQRQIGLLILVCAVLMIGINQLVSAQESSTQGFYVIRGENGTITETGDGTYELALEGVAPTLEWMVSVPEYFAGGYETALFVAEWSANTETPLTATALLHTEAATLRMTAGMPAYDPLTGILTVQISEVEVFPVEENSKKKGGDLPDEFEAATLTLVLDTNFDAGLAAGAKILEEEGRVTRSNQSQRPGPPRQTRP